MVQCDVVCPAKSTYNAVNIKINNPRANVSDNSKIQKNDSDFNAVNLEINNPELEQKPIYSYPTNDEIVTADMVLPVETAELPLIPAAYEVNSQTHINTDNDTDKKKAGSTTSVPEPYLTNTENEKNLSFHGISFKAASKPVITKDANIRPAIDINKVTDNLTSDDFDVQAKQMERIVSDALNNNKNASDYISTLVFSTLIDIAERNTSALTGPTEEQKEIRQRIITNEIAKAKQSAEGIKPEEIKLPYTVTSEEFSKASVLSPFEMAERNKEYALLTLAALSKIYADEYKEKVGNVVSLTDLPGASTMVETLKSSKNPSVRIAAIESLIYINRPEYQKEITAVLDVAAQDKNIAVASTALEALNYINM